MHVVDIKGVHEVRNVSHLQAILMCRCENDANSFWLSHGDEEYPTLCLLVKGDLATLNFIPKEFDAGYRSVGRMPELTEGETTTFSISKNRADDVVVLNAAVLPFSATLRAAMEFFSSKDLPQSVEWLRL